MTDDIGERIDKIDNWIARLKYLVHHLEHEIELSQIREYLEQQRRDLIDQIAEEIAA